MTEPPSPERQPKRILRITTFGAEYIDLEPTTEEETTDADQDEPR